MLIWILLYFTIWFCSLNAQIGKVLLLWMLKLESTMQGVCIWLLDSLEGFCFYKNLGAPSIIHAVVPVTDPPPTSRWDQPNLHVNIYESYNMSPRVDFKSVESPPYMRGRRILTVVVRVASPSFPCARQFFVMHSGTKGGATSTDGRICTPHGSWKFFSTYI